jgi:hypothetical protein
VGTKTASLSMRWNGNGGIQEECNTPDKTKQQVGQGVDAERGAFAAAMMEMVHAHAVQRVRMNGILHGSESVCCPLQTHHNIILNTSNVRISRGGCIHSALSHVV